MKPLNSLFTLLFLSFPFWSFSALDDSLTVQIIDNERFILHKVDPGEFLSRVCIRYKVDPQIVLDFNEIEDNTLQPGQILYIPEKFQGVFNRPGEKNALLEKNGTINPFSGKKIHRVSTKQTLYSISKMYSLSVEDLKALNGLIDNTIFIDQKLIVSGRPEIAPPTEPARVLAVVNPSDFKVKITETAPEIIPEPSVVETNISQPVKVISSPLETPAPKKESSGKTVDIIHVSRTVESVYNLSQQYQIDPEAIIERNNLKSTIIMTGQKVFIPVKVENVGEKVVEKVEKVEPPVLVTRTQVEKSPEPVKTTPPPIKEKSVVIKNDNLIPTSSTNGKEEVVVEVGEASQTKTQELESKIQALEEKLNRLLEQDKEVEKEKPSKSAKNNTKEPSSAKSPKEPKPRKTEVPKEKTEPKPKKTEVPKKRVVVKDKDEPKPEVVAQKKVIPTPPVKEVVVYQPKEVKSPVPEGKEGVTLDPRRGRKVHVVREEETIFSIAANYGMTVNEIRAMNRKTNNKISVGESILVYASKKSKTSGISTPIRERLIPRPVGTNAAKVVLAEKKPVVPPKKRKDVPQVRVEASQPLAPSKITEIQSLQKETAPIKLPQKPKNIIPITAKYEISKDKIFGKKYFKVSESGKMSLLKEGSGDAQKFIGYHKTLPLGTIIMIENPKSKRLVTVKIDGKLGKGEDSLMKISPLAGEYLMYSNSQDDYIIRYSIAEE